jgi:hypothetical protein
MLSIVDGESSHLQVALLLALCNVCIPVDVARKCVFVQVIGREGNNVMDY